MKYIIFSIGIIIIILRSIGIDIDPYSIGLFIIIAVLVQLKNLNQLSEFSGFGIKMKFRKELQALSNDTESIESNLEYSLNKGKTLNGIDEGDSFNEHFSNLIGPEDIKYDFRNPKSTLIEIAISIEKTLRNISKETLVIDNNFPIAPKRIIDELSKKSLINKDVASAFYSFWNLRNNVVHGLDNSFGDVQIYSLIDSGLKILNILNLIENNIKKGVKISILS